MSRARATTKAALRRALRVLPPPRDEAAVRLLRAARDLVTGRVPPPPPPPSQRRKRPAQRRFGSPTGPPLPKVPRVENSEEWLVAPTPEVEGIGSGFHVHPTVRRQRLDVDLLERLNEEYRERRLVTSPRAYTSEALAEAATNRVTWAHHVVDLRDKTVLEVGCGDGFETWSMAHNLGADATGVDLQSSPRWEHLRGERVHLRQADLTEHNPFAPDSFDRVVSYTVWEHVLHPHRLLQETFDVMRPGGLQWLRANLWAGPQASHRYRDIYFPWPHHLFSDDVIAEWDAAHGREPEGAAWVNKLTWNHYERYVHDVGFRLRGVVFQKAEWDEEFYQRFEDVLGRIPRWDLERDFFNAVLEKPVRRR